MKILGKFLMALLLLIILMLATLYGLIQTRWGAGLTGSWISDYTDYSLSVTKIEHSFSRPLHLVLHKVAFGKDGMPAAVTAKRVDLGFTYTQFINPLRFGSVSLSRGNVTFSDKKIAWPLQAGLLQLNEMNITSLYCGLPLYAEHVSSRLLPWQPVTGNGLGNHASFQLTAKSMKINNLISNTIRLAGRLENQRLILNDIQASLAHGSVSGRAERDGQGNWQIDNLKFNNIRQQSQQTLARFLQPHFPVNSIQVKHAEINHLHLQGPDWAIADLKLKVNNVTFRQGHWESQKGSLSMQASYFINGQLSLHNPLIDVLFSEKEITVLKFSTHWMKGVISATGQWLNSRRRLQIDLLDVEGLELVLPADWRERWMQPLPKWSDSVVVRRFTAQNNLIIDVNPAFPFQITALNGSGSHLLLVRDHQWGIWSGELNAYAAQATFNRTDIQRPALVLISDPHQIKLTEVSASAYGGALNASATLQQQPERTLNLTLSGHAVPVNLLDNWGWSVGAIQGKGAIKLNLEASLAAGRPLCQSVTGRLSADSGHQHVQQKMRAGELCP